MKSDGKDKFNVLDKESFSTTPVFDPQAESSSSAPPPALAILLLAPPDRLPRHRKASAEPKTLFMGQTINV